MLILFILLLQAVAAGVTQAILYSRKASEAFKGNEHLVYMTERILIGLACFLPIFISVELTWHHLLLWIASYSFFYNGAYYEARKRIDGSYPRGWMSDPRHDSTAWINQTFSQRVTTIVLAIIIILLSN